MFFISLVGISNLVEAFVLESGDAELKKEPEFDSKFLVSIGDSNFSSKSLGLKSQDL